MRIYSAIKAYFKLIRVVFIVIIGLLCGYVIHIIFKIYYLVLRFLFELKRILKLIF
jgi:hypothetical protein